MLPTGYQDDLTQDYDIVEHPTRTYNLNFSGGPSVGMLDGLEAMKQAIFLILNTERFQHEIYSWNYGNEFADLIGEPNTPLLQVRLKTAITEALLQDDRILSVDNFSFERKGACLTVSFTVVTTEGKIQSAVNWRGGSLEVKL